MAFPTNVMSLAAAAGSNFLNLCFGGSVAMSTGLNTFISHIVATQKKLGTGSVTAPARGQALIAMGTADGDGNQQSTWDSLSRRNILVNGTGRTKQRTTLPTTDNAYGFDRARVLMENANGFTLSQETSTLPTAPGALYGMKHVVGSGNNGKGGYWQPVLFADMNDLAGGVVSLQCKLYISHSRLANMRVGLMQWTSTADSISADPVNAWGADGTNPTLTTNWSFVNTPASQALSATTWTTVYIENQTVSSSAKNLAVMVWNDARTTTAADFFIVTDIQLERGAVCTAVERTPEPIERALCRDWYRVIGPGSVNTCYATGLSTANNNALYSFPLGPPMRTTPTLTLSAVSDFTSSDGANATLNALSIGAGSPETLQLSGTQAGTTWTTGRANLLLGSTSAQLRFSAEP